MTASPLRGQQAGDGAGIESVGADTVDGASEAGRAVWWNLVPACDRHFPAVAGAEPDGAGAEPSFAQPDMARVTRAARDRAAEA